MTVLSDRTIRDLLDSGDLDISPIDLDSQIQPCSVDLTLSGHTIPLNEDYCPKTDQEEITFHPQIPYLGSTREYIDLPDGVCGMLKGRSSIGRMGVQIHTAGWIDAGFHGELTLEIMNFTDEPKTFQRGTRFCQLVLIPLDSRPLEPYREKEDAKYNGQQGATESRYEDK
jgi:dCTP deaminase